MSNNYDYFDIKKLLKLCDFKAGDILLRSPSWFLRVRV